MVNDDQYDGGTFEDEKGATNSNYEKKKEQANTDNVFNVVRVVWMPILAIVL